MEQKKREELLRSVNLNSNRNSNEVHLCLEHENNELRYNNRMSRANDGKIYLNYICKKI